MEEQEIDFDRQDWINLLELVFKAAVNDYIQLLHPSKRKRSNLADALGSAHDFLFDDTYQSMKIKTPEGESMTLRELLAYVYPDMHIDIEEMRENILNQAIEHWTVPKTRVIAIPEYVILGGKVFSVIPGDQYELDMDANLIIIPQKFNDSDFIEILMQITLQQADVKLSTSATKRLASKWYELLRMNNCFLSH